MAVIFEWVTSSLRDPGTMYELIMPGRKPLAPTMGSLADADLLPSAMLNFRPSEALKMSHGPTVSDNLLQQIQ